MKTPLNAVMGITSCTVWSVLIVLIIQDITTGTLENDFVFLSLKVAALILFSVIFLIDFTYLMTSNPLVIDTNNGLEIKETFRNRIFRKGHTKRYIFMSTNKFLGWVMLADGDKTGFYFRSHFDDTDFSKIMSL
jgi:hypothetical protein